jgi:hypothetical protein
VPSVLPAKNIHVIVNNIILTVEELQCSESSWCYRGGYTWRVGTAWKVIPNRTMPKVRPGVGRLQDNTEPKLLLAIDPAFRNTKQTWPPCYSENSTHLTLQIFILLWIFWISTINLQRTVKIIHVYGIHMHTKIYMYIYICDYFEYWWTRIYKVMDDQMLYRKHRSKLDLHPRSHDVWKTK